MTRCFPFAAITGHEQAKKALLCALASDEIHSVLITGERGTGKSVLARSLADFLPHDDLLAVPQNITTDRLLGSIDLEAAVTVGTVRYTPGLLEQGNGRVLYVDDINLMDEGILNRLLAAAETGEVLFEREGLSRRVWSRFLLIATMDPAEGDLTPAEMDRFDLCVQLQGVADENGRKEIVCNRFRFERDPLAFDGEYAPEEQKTAQTIRTARERLPYVSIPEGHADLIASVCLELGVSGQRGDLAAARAAKALAALDGRDSVEFEDVKLAALLALEHRRHDNGECPPPTPPQDKSPDEPQDPEEDTENDTQESSPQCQSNRSGPAPGQQPEQCGKSPAIKDEPRPVPQKEQIFSVGPAFAVIRYMDKESMKVTRKQKSGRRTRVISTDATGHYRSFCQPKKDPPDIALTATLRAAAPYQAARERHGLAISVQKRDLREKVREKKIAHTILFLVDASGSMGARQRMVAVKGTILSLLTDAYQKRDRVGLMVFRGSDARLLLPPTRSPELAVKLLRALPTGGMTPLTKGIASASELLTRGRYSSTCENRSLVILTDGRVNVAWKGGKPPYEELWDLARSLAGSGIRYIVVDTEEGYPRLGRAQVLAGNLEASYFRLEDLRERQLAGMVQDAVYTHG